jgi:hypothetical protein
LRNERSLSKSKRTGIAKFQRVGTILGFPPENERPFHRERGQKVGPMVKTWTQEVYKKTSTGE